MSHNEQEVAKQLQIDLTRQAMADAESAFDKKNKQISAAAARMAKFSQYLRDNMGPFEQDKLLKDAKELAELQAALDRARGDYENALREQNAPPPQLLSANLSPSLTGTSSSSLARFVLSSQQAPLFETVYSQPSTASALSTFSFSTPQPHQHSTIHLSDSASMSSAVHFSEPVTASSLFVSSATASSFSTPLQFSAPSFGSSSRLPPPSSTLLASSLEFNDQEDSYRLLDESLNQSQLQLDGLLDEQRTQIQAQLGKLRELNASLDLYLNDQDLNDVHLASQYLSNVTYLAEIAGKIHDIANDIASFSEALRDEITPLTHELAAIQQKAETYKKRLSDKFGDALEIIAPYTIEQIEEDINSFNFVDCNIGEVVSNLASADAQTQLAARLAFTDYHQALENATKLRDGFRAVLATDDGVFARINQVLHTAMMASVQAQNNHEPDLHLQWYNHAAVSASVSMVDDAVSVGDVDSVDALSPDEHVPLFSVPTVLPHPAIVKRAPPPPSALGLSASVDDDSSVGDGVSVDDGSSADEEAYLSADEHTLAKIKILADSINQRYALIADATEVDEPNKFLANAKYRLDRAILIRDEAASWTELPIDSDILASMDEEIADARANLGRIKAKLVTLYGDVIDDNGQADDIAAIEASIVDPLQDGIDLGLDGMDFESEDYDPILQAAQNLTDFEQKLKNAHAQREAHLDILATDDEALTRIDDAIEAAEHQLNDAKNEVARHLDALAQVIADKSQQVTRVCDEEEEPDYAQLKADMDAIDAAHRLISAVAEINDGSEESNSAQQKLQVANGQRTAAWQSFIPVAVNFHRKKAQDIYTVEREALNNFNPAEIGAAAKLARAKARLLEASDGLAQARNCVALHDPEDEADHLTAIAEDETNLTSLTNEVATWQSQLDSYPCKFLSRTTPYLANILIEKHGALDGFVDKLIRKGGRFNEGLEEAEVATAYDVSAGYSRVTYENARLREGDVIRTHINFNRVDARSGRPVIGLLKQDHSAQVSNFSRGLTDAEQNKVAFKQAQMLLNNYKPGSGDIILRGENTTLANKVYASLLLLTDSHPQFYNLEIKSFVPGCTGPYFFTRSFFINRHLGEGLSEELRNTAQDTLRETTDMRFFRLEKYYKNKAEIYRDPKLLEGESLDITGKVMPNPYLIDYCGQSEGNQPNTIDYTEQSQGSPVYCGS